MIRRYRGVVVFRYYQEVTVEVEDGGVNDDQPEAIARASMCDMFDLSLCFDGESEVFNLEEVTQPEQEPERYTTHGMQVRQAIRQALATQGGTE